MNFRPAALHLHCVCSNISKIVHCDIIFRENTTMTILFVALLWELKHGVQIGKPRQ